MEVVALLSQGRTAAAQCGLFTHKSVPVIFEPPCKINCFADQYRGKSKCWYTCPVSNFLNICLKFEKPMLSHGRTDGHAFFMIHLFRFIKNFLKVVTSTKLAT